MYEIFDHTADLGLRIRADDLNALFAEAGCALFSVIVENLDEVRPDREVAFEIEAEGTEELLRDWLAELLWRFYADHLLLARFNVEVHGTQLKATARGETVDPKRHQLDAEIKAITYHGLKVEHGADGWLAEVIVDV